MTHKTCPVCGTTAVTLVTPLEFNPDEGTASKLYQCRECHAFFRELFNLQCIQTEVASKVYENVNTVKSLSSILYGIAVGTPIHVYDKDTGKTHALSVVHDITGGKVRLVIESRKGI